LALAKRLPETYGLGMNERYPPEVRANTRIGHRAATSGPGSRQSTHRSARNHADGVTEAREIDAAFVRWLGAKLADSDPDTCEEDLINYLIALALRGVDSHGECWL
jgi:hypothetical protein